jgi:hypothetical protein
MFVERLRVLTIAAAVFFCGDHLGIGTDCSSSTAMWSLPMKRSTFWLYPLSWRLRRLPQQIAVVRNLRRPMTRGTIHHQSIAAGLASLS